jgi:hypothetical protein
MRNQPKRIHVHIDFAVESGMCKLNSFENYEKKIEKREQII